MQAVLVVNDHHGPWVERLRILHIEVLRTVRPGKNDVSAHDEVTVHLEFA
jgi:hypothetical protein